MALHYSGAAEGRPLPIVLELEVGPVDRGACIRELSQYPREFEYLFLPMSFVSPNGPPRFTVSEAGLCVRVIPVRININLSARTVEELLGQKKRMHCAAFRFLVGELDEELQFLAENRGGAARFLEDKTKNQDGKHSVEGLCKRIVEQFEEVLKVHAARAEQNYTDDAVYQGLVTEMLNARRWAVSKLRLWLEDHTQSIRFAVYYTLRDAHRRLTANLARAADAADTEEARRAASLEVCKARGLLRARVYEVNDALESPLTSAAADGAAPADIRLLIAAGSAVNEAEGGPSVAAVNAAMYGQVEVLATLLEAKAAVNAADEKKRKHPWSQSKTKVQKCYSIICWFICAVVSI